MKLAVLVMAILLICGVASAQDSTTYVNAWAKVYTNGLTISEGFFYNGVQYGVVMNAFRTPQDVINNWLYFPGVKQYLSGVLRYGIVPSNEWMNIFSKCLTVDLGYGALDTCEVGDDITVKSASGVICAFGEIEANGVLRFTPVYADDGYDPGITGAFYNETLTLMINGTPVYPTFKYTGFGTKKEFTTVSYGKK